MELNRRFIAAFLALVFALTTLVLGLSLSAKADEQNKDILFHNQAVMDEDGFVMKTIQKNANGLALAKGVKSNGNGSYDIKLESYSTGEAKKVPTDFVLVLDQSGSMETVDMATDFNTTAINNKWTFDTQGRITNINGDANPDGKTAYYYKVTDEDGNDHYYRVYTKRGEMYTYYPSDSLQPGDVIDSNNFKIFQKTSIEQSPNTAYYYKDSNGTYNQLKFLTKGKFLEYTVDVGYVDSNGNTVVEPFYRPERPDYLNIFNGNRISYVENTPWYDVTTNAFYNSVNAAVQLFTSTIGGTTTGYAYGKIDIVGAETGMYFRFPMYKRYVGYNQLCYTDGDGIEHKLINAEYCKADGTPVGGTCSEADDGAPYGNETSQNQAFWRGNLYTASDLESRLESLNTAAKSFIDKVAAETITDEQGNVQRVDHRIAVVGFSSGNDSTHSFNNNELLSPASSVSPNNEFEGAALDSNGNLVTADDGTVIGFDGPQYNTTAGDDGNISSGDYQNALVSIRSNDENDPDSNVNSLKQSIDYVTAYGGTEPQHGFNMARNIFSNRQSETYTKTDGDEALRNTVVIFFTDGRPGNYSNSNQYDAANLVVSASEKVKKQKTQDGSKSLNTKVYSIGVFGESDGNPLTYSKYSETNYRYGINGPEHNYSYDEDYDTHQEIYPYDNDFVDKETGTTASGNYEYTDYLYRAWHSADSNYSQQPDDTIRSYMTTVSSEYPDATSFSNLSAGANHASDRGDKGQGKYYYLASDRATLNNAFAEIFEKEAQSDSSYNPENSYLRDTVASCFDTSNATITVKTMSPTGFDSETGAVLGWEDASTSSDNATSSWHPGERVIDVTGFDYTNHYVSKDNVEDNDNLSRKLVVILSGVTTSETGTDIKTNVEANSGIYYKENPTEDNPIPEFKNENKFPVPSISRIKYTIRHVGDNPTPQLSTKLYLLNQDGSQISSLPATTKIYEADEAGEVTNKTTVTYPEINTLLTGYDWVTQYTTGTEYAIIFENLGENYQLKAETSNADDSDNYTYTWGDGTTEAQATNSFDQQNKFEKAMPLEDHDLVIKSKTNNHDVTILNQTVKNHEQDEDYSDSTKVFPINLTLAKEGSTEFADKTIQGTDQNGNPVTVQFTNGVATVNLKHNESVTLSLPVGYSVAVEDASEPTAYTTTYKVDSNDETTTPAATDTNADRNIVVKHERNKETIATTGVEEEPASVSAIMYTLAGILTLSSGAYFVYEKRKKAMQ